MLAMTEPAVRRRGRPAKKKMCVVCHEDKNTSLFPSPRTAAVPDRCRACSKAATEARAAAVAVEIAQTRAQKVQKAEQAAQEAEVAREERRLAKLRENPKIIQFRQEFEERQANRKAVDATTVFFQSICTVRCECCYTAPATGRDSIGGRSWCQHCGWGIERTGRCLAHPGGELFYAGLPQAGIELPPELIATMRLPAVAPMTQEKPPTMPDDLPLTDD